MQAALLLELLGQVIQSLQAADLRQEPLLVALLHLLQTFPGVGDVLEERRGRERARGGVRGAPAHRANRQRGAYFCEGRRRTDTILPSEGMKAGLLLSLSLVCRVLKLISSWHFSCTRGGLWMRR